MSLKDLFKNFFKDEEVEETLVDPIVEQRRKEKFSAPLIYNDEIEEIEERAVEKKPSKSVNQVKRPKVEQSYTYSMTEIISPMMGKKETVKPATQPAAKKVKKKKAVDFKDQLVPVISPFYGNTAVEEEFVEQLEEKKETVKTVTYNSNEPKSVTENLRNLAKIIQEEDNQLKIIEARTGEFQLDFSNVEGGEKTLIDEIDDEMTLDELMSLYEKKKMND